MKLNGLQKEYKLLENDNKSNKSLFLWIIFVSLFIIVSISSYAFYLLYDPQHGVACKLNCIDDEGKIIRNIDYEDNIPRFNVDKDGDGIADTNMVDVLDNNGKCIKNCTRGSSNGRPITNIDFNDDGVPNINIDVNDDGEPDINIDINGDGKADLNVDTDNDGEPDTNITIDNRKANTNIDYYDGIPHFNVEDENGSIINQVNKEVNGIILNKDINNDGIPDINIDMDNDGISDLNTDINGDNKPDLNIDLDKNGTPDISIDSNQDGICEEFCNSMNVMENNICIINCDTDNDGFPDKNTDINGDLFCDANCDTDNDGEIDTNIVINNNGICVMACVGGIDNFANFTENINTIVLTNYKKVIEEKKVGPGWEDKVELNVSNNTPDYIVYEIKFDEVTNEFSERNNILYELREDGIIKSKSTLPYEANSIITLKIPPKSTYKYNLYLEFVERNENQNEDSGKRFIASVIINLMD